MVSKPSLLSYETVRIVASDLNFPCRRCVIYNISWEDPKVERELLKFGPKDRILTISSAGCNVLDYLIDGPEVIVAADLNVAQLSVLELKLAAIKTLSFDDFFALWGESNVLTFKKFYRSTLRPLLTPNTALFWDENETLFRDNFMFAGTSGLMAWLLQWPIRLSGMRDHMMRRVTTAPKSIGLKVVAYLAKCTTMWTWLAPLAGVPRSQLDLIAREPHVFSERLIEVLQTRMWQSDNYFYYGYVVGRFSRDCCPRYLEQRHFATLKKHADRVILHHGPLLEAAQRAERFTVASILDSMDWMPDTMIADQLSGLLPRMANGGHIYWRSFATKVHSPPLAQLLPKLVPTYDRVGWYLTQYVATVQDNTVRFDHFTLPGTDYSPKNSVVDEARVIAAMAMHGLRKHKDVEQFYKSQGEAYDGFRENLLPNRDRLLRYNVPWHQTPKTWVSVGCGTARDIEYVVGQLKACNTHVYLCDLSPDLLKVAKARIERLGLSAQVTFVQANICAPDDELVASGLPPLGSVDVVTCSYCLTMIPQWQTALQQMKKLVKVGGTLALVDFTKRSDAPQHWTQRLNRWWFAHDGVWFNDAHTKALLEDAAFSTVWFNESESRVPYMPLRATNYIYSGIKVKSGMA